MTSVSILTQGRLRAYAGQVWLVTKIYDDAYIPAKEKARILSEGQYSNGQPCVEYIRKTDGGAGGWDWPSAITLIRRIDVSPPKGKRRGKK